MKNFCLITTLFLITIISLQAQNPQLLRKQGFEAKVKGDYPLAIERYKAIMNINFEDYDARLALGNLYYITKLYDSARYFYLLIFQNDPRDIEAINGLGRCWFAEEKYQKAVYYFTLSVNYLPTYSSAYFDLAQSYIALNKLDSALWAYQMLLAVDNTYAEAWAGMAKMNYWKNNPYLAVEQYEKAVELDPSNPEYREMVKRIKGSLEFNNNFKTMYVQENEESYTIKSQGGRYTITKRISNRFSLGGGLHLEYASRDFTTLPGDTLRWFSNTWLLASYQTEKSVLTLNTGYSATDKTFSSYGFNWRFANSWNKIKYVNTLEAGHDYFYYWNEVSRKFISESLELNYLKTGLQLKYLAGRVDEATVSDYYRSQYSDTVNPHRMYAASVWYYLFRKPDIKFSLAWSFLDFDYKSPLYYTPYERKYFSPSISIYHKLRKTYVYADFVYNLGNEAYYEEITAGQFEKKLLEDIDGWSGSVEAGYTFNGFTLSVGVSRFYNPYYQNLVVFINCNWQL